MLNVTGWLASTLLAVMILLLSNSTVAQPEPELALEKVRLQLKWKHQFQFAGFYAALKQGYYADAGFDVDILPVNFQRRASEVVLSGAAEFGVADSSLVLSRLQGKPVVILAAVFQHSPLVLISKQSSNILSPLELVGKRVMFQRNVDDAVLIAMFTEFGLNDDQYSHVPHSFKDDALLNGEVDVMSGYITDQPYLYIEKNIEINVISPASYGIDFYGDMLFTREDYLKNNKQKVLRFREASLKGWEYAIAHPKKMAEWIFKNLETEKTLAHLLYEAESTVRLIKPQLVELGYFSLNRFGRISDIYKQLGLADITQDIEGINYLDYYQEQAQHGWLKLLLLALALTLSVAFILWAYNHRLKKQVALRSQALVEARDELGYYLDVVDRYVINSVMNTKGEFTRVSQAFCEASGYTAAELLGKHFDYLAHESSLVMLRDAFNVALVEQGAWSGELLLQHKTEGVFWLMMDLESVVDAKGRLAGLMEISVNISDKKRIEALSSIDPLTSLYNRRGLGDAFNHSIALAKRYNKKFSIIIFDVDYFKRINDSYGHSQGDEVIRAVADIMRDTIREADVPGRWGGEEFVVFCPETDLQGAYFLAEKLRIKISNYSFTDLPKQSCSFGVAEWSTDDSYESLITRADNYLYKAKAKGRNCSEGLTHRTAEII
ncbi:ABC transporter substrate-binding protein [Dasania marina]|uniref:ABC transporter substrate-binding protein n=1 Tax=Dasania marina TaxID=471499 RepID=UPI0030D7A1C7|tara:strand:- start:754 stop:2745 length:1992 start_codon:yes stop_codon:yes gene_type:complete